MIVLFNTAYRPGYLRNILRTIFLPGGAKNQYRYTIGKNISAKDVSDIQKRGASQKVLVCFGDRFSEGGYTFHPVRYGRLDSIESAGGRVYFRVCLNEHVSCDSANDFTRALYDLAAQEGLSPPRLIGGDPENPKDGTYAICIDSSALESHLSVTEQSWSSTALDLAKTPAFSSGPKYVFAKCDLIVNGKLQHYSLGEHLPRYEIDRDSDARIAISYVFPGQNEGSGSAANLVLTTPPGMQLLGAAVQVLDMPENRLEFPFVIEPGADKNFFSVDASIKSIADSSDDVVGPNDSLAFRVHDPVWRPIVAGLSFFVYLFGAWLSAGGPENSSLGEVFKALGIAGIFFSLRGKRIV